MKYLYIFRGGTLVYGARGRHMWDDRFGQCMLSVCVASRLVSPSQTTSQLPPRRYFAVRLGWTSGTRRLCTFRRPLPALYHDIVVYHVCTPVLFRLALSRRS